MTVNRKQDYPSDVVAYFNRRSFSGGGSEGG